MSYCVMCEKRTISWEICCSSNFMICPDCIVNNPEFGPDVICDGCDREIGRKLFYGSREDAKDYLYNCSYQRSRQLHYNPRGFISGPYDRFDDRPPRGNQWRQRDHHQDSGDHKYDIRRPNKITQYRRQNPIRPEDNYQYSPNFRV